MGRKKKPNELKKLSGSEYYDPKIPKARGKPRMPPDMLPDAKWAWQYIVPRLDALGVLDQLDMPGLMALCDAMGQFRLASRELARDGNRHVIRTTNGNYIQNPWVGIKRTARQDVMQYAASFGLLPSDRDKLLAKNPEEELSLAEEFQAAMRG